MSAQQSDLPSENPGADVDPAVERELVRRANQLCRRAEPHTDRSPCAAHRAEAHRQLHGLAG
jgi:hypothetical protein